MVLTSLLAFSAILNTPAAIDSGLKVGDRVPAYEPHHVLGPDKDTDTCPVCKYGSLPAIQVWIGSERRDDLFAITRRLSALVAKYEDVHLKAFVIFVKDERLPKADYENQLISWMKPVSVANVGIAYVPEGDPSIAEYKINRENSVLNTVMVYRRGFVGTKIVNLTEAKLADLDRAVAEITKN